MLAHLACRLRFFSWARLSKLASCPCVEHAHQTSSTPPACLLHAGHVQRHSHKPGITKEFNSLSIITQMFALISSWQRNFGTLCFTPPPPKHVFRVKERIHTLTALTHTCGDNFLVYMLMQSLQFYPRTPLLLAPGASWEPIHIWETMSC